MRLVFFLLLLGNVLLASFILLEQRGSDAVLPPPLNADKIKLLPPVAAPERAKSAAQRAAPAQACLEWGSFVGTELQRAESALAALQIGDKLHQKSVGEVTAFWVHLPPQKTRQDADKKIAELTKLGVTEYFLVQDNSKWHNAISLELFRSEEAAKKLLQDLRARGVKSATISERSLRQIALVLREPTAEVAQKMVGIAQGFAGSELKTGTCNGNAQPVS